ncbi:MAG: alpha/beta hydrolase [Ruminococcus sp.]|nr:alpha/beta hydrolase [Ruminococcus sp.]
MTVFLIILLILLLLYILFIVVPAIFIYRFAFGRKPCSTPLTERDLEGTRYAPFSEQLVPAEHFVQEQPSETVSIEARDGVTLYGRYFNQNSPHTMIFVHGYAGAYISNFCAQAQRFYQHGWNLLFIIQRGHGDSGGKRIGLGTTEQYDLLRWANFAAECKGVEDIVFYGSSMGSTALAYASDQFIQPKVRALVLDCAYTSPYRQLGRDSHAKYLPLALLLPVIRLIAMKDLHEDIKTPVGESLKNTRIPVLFLHGEADRTVPVSDCKENYEACGSEKKMILVPDADHILAYVTGGEEVMQQTEDFITLHLSKGRSL